MTWVEGLKWLDTRHPDWREYADGMSLLGMVWMAEGLHDPFRPPKHTDLAYDDLYHIISNTPGCGSPEGEMAIA